jgi:N-acetylmuramic acid 6-phosphate etherase
MVDVVATNRKLEGRARRIVRRLLGCDEAEAARLLGVAGGRVKEAVVCGRFGVGADEARAVLAGAGGCLRRALESKRPC